MKAKELRRYAILFKHPTGWTYVTSDASAGGARAYIRNHKSTFDQFQWKIAPCKIVLNLPDAVAARFR